MPILLLQVNQNLEEKIVRFLSTQHSVSAIQIWKALTVSEQKRCTLQAIYKGLLKLQKEGVIVKASTLYSLSTSWIFNLVSFADQLYKKQVDTSSLQMILPNGTKATWNFNSIPRMHDFWSHLILIALKNSSEKFVFEWLPHPWYQLIHTTKLSSFRKALLMISERFYIIVGGDGFLDRICEPYWKSRKIYQYSFSKSDLDLPLSRGVLVIGEFIITLDFLPSFANKLDSFFKETNSLQGPEIGEILQFLSRRTSLTLKFEKNPRKAALLKRKFIRHFGLVES